MREPATTRPRLYTIPPSAPFLSTLARAVLAGDLPVACGTKPDPLELPRAVIYLPTRRAVRALRDAFLDAAGGAAVLLPSIRALGDPDEDEAIIFGGEGDTEEGFARAGGARAIDPLERRLALMRLVLAWSKRLHESGGASPGQPVPPIATPAQASYLAADLGILMDFIESEEVDLSALEDLALALLGPAFVADAGPGQVDDDVALGQGVGLDLAGLGVPVGRAPPGRARPDHPQHLMALAAQGRQQF